MKTNVMLKEKEIGSYQVADKPMLSGRVQRLKESFNEIEVRTSLERAKFLLEVYQEAGGEPTIITRAKVLDRYLRGMTIFIDENPIVGTLTQFRRGVNPCPDYDITTKLISSFGDVILSDEEKELFERVDEFFRNKSHLARTNEIFQELTGVDRVYLRDNAFWMDIVGFPLGYLLPPYEKLLSKGLRELIQEAEQALEGINVLNYREFKKRDFYQAAIISLNAVIAWANRYADLAEKMAEKENNAEKKAAFQEIASTSRRVPEYPARNFREALQFYWFIHAALWIEQPSAAIVPGRFPQYMYPYYKKDMELGKITEEDTIELLELLCIKLSEIGVQNPSKTLMKGGQQHTAQSFVLGGFTPDGKDATNDIDFLWLEAEKRVRMIQPSTVAVLHNNISDAFLMKCMDVIKIGLGKPALINGHMAVVRNLDRWNCSLEEAYDFTVFGCSQSFPRHSTDGSWGGLLNTPKILSLTLNNGIDPLTGRQAGLKTGDAQDFKTYEEFYEAFMKQFLYFTGLIRKLHTISDNVHAKYYPVPLASVFTDDCMKRGKDRYNGGAKYAGDLDCPAGVVDTANSLRAIKQIVFEEKKVTMDTLNQALKANFVGYEELQHRLSGVVKYGNEDDSVDRIVRSLYDEFAKEDLSYENRLGKDHKGGRPYAIVVSGHGNFGAHVGAQPNGRACGSLTDGTVSATPGTDRKGPTALLRSASGAIDMRKYAGNIFNMKLHPTALATESDQKKLIAMIKTYMDMGGYHIQFNVASAKLLKEAQKHPDQYRNLVIRVAGFSAFFVLLDADIQNEIIARTEYSSCC